MSSSKNILACIRTLRQVFIRVGGMEAAATAAEAVPAAAVQAGGSPLGASSGRR